MDKILANVVITVHKTCWRSDNTQHISHKKNYIRTVFLHNTHPWYRDTTKVLSLQPMIPLKRFDIPPPCLGDAQKI